MGVPEVYRVTRVPGVHEDTGVPNYCRDLEVPGYYRDTESTARLNGFRSANLNRNARESERCEDAVVVCCKGTGRLGC